MTTTTASTTSTGRKRRFGTRNNRNWVPTEVSAALAARFSKLEIQAISQLSTLIDVDADRTLMAEAQIGGEAFVVVEGTANVTRAGKTVAEIGPGDIVGEGALLRLDRRNADVLATSALRVLVMNPREFSSLLSQRPQLDNRVRKIASERNEGAVDGD